MTETLPQEDIDAEEDPAVEPSHLRFPVVGIGASAGGLEALLTFFEHLPADNGMAFVVVLHLSPDHPSAAHEILGRATRMPVTAVVGNRKIEADHVYVIPPGHLLAMTDGSLIVTPTERPRGKHVAIDLFFRSLAQAHRERAMCVVLSGTGADGSAGLTRVKERGGMTFVQHPDDAQFDAMPRSAIGTGMVDFVLPAAELPGKLTTLWANALKIVLPDADVLGMAAAEPPASARAAEKAELALRDVMTMLRNRTGNDFKHYKRGTVLRRLERRLQVNGLPDLPTYRDFLEENTAETGALLQDMLISVTNFFRDPDAFDALERDALKPLFAGRTGSEPVRAWVPGCATGEEAYSLAMLLCEQASEQARRTEVVVFATDIDEKAVRVARTGSYSTGIVTDVAPTRLRRFFAREDGHYVIKKPLREKLLFATHNLLRDPPFSRLDLISCRNLLIYLSREVQRELFEVFHFALKPGGTLFLGSSEVADPSNGLFTPVSKKHRIYRANPVPRHGRYAATLPLRPHGVPIPSHEPPPPTERPSVSIARIHTQAIEKAAPPSVLVDTDHRIVHLTDGVGRFLQHTGGMPSMDLLTQVHPELRLELRTALFNATQGEKGLEPHGVRLERDGRTTRVTITARPVADEASSRQFLLVTFAETDGSGEGEGEGEGGQPAGDGGRGRMVTQLEEQLRAAKEQWQGVIEQAETTTEDLKASNEELQAINEELRSTTEELETSKEELQSINEELITVNFELKVKVEETTQVNDDLHNFIASTDIATIFIDANMRIKRYTPRASTIFNMIGTDVGRSLWDITHRLDYPALAADATEVFRSLQPVEREIVSSDGHWYLARTVPYRTGDDRIQGAVLSFVDITRRRLAEEQMRVGEERMRLVADSALDYAIVTLDDRGHVASWNVGAQILFGHTEAQVVGAHYQLLFPDDAHGDGAEHDLREATAKDRVQWERWLVRHDGSRVYCNGSTSRLAGGRNGFALIARDLTTQREAAAERESLLERERAVRAEAETANRLKDEFLAVMSHELKQPLNLINLNAALIKRMKSLDQGPRIAEAIYAAVTSQTRIIDDMLDFSRLRMGKLRLERHPVDLQALLRPVIAGFQPEAEARKISLTLEAPEKPLVVAGDPLRLDQIAWNLLSNALKFSRSGDTIVMALAREGRMARIVVTDTGQGIEEAQIGHLFEMFRQGDSRSTRRTGGLGIGLALVRELALLHEGRVAVHSDGPGKGATFTVWVPLFGPMPVPVETPAEPTEADLRGERLLVVDDSPEALAMLGDLLRGVGAEVVTASGGAEALALAAKQDFGLILSDVGMPEMDGYELIHRLRATERHAHTLAIVLTGFARTDDAQRSLDAGFDAHLGKPFQIDVLCGLIRQLRETRGQHDGDGAH